MPWFGGDMLEILGPGVMAKAIAEAKAVEKYYKNGCALFDALTAEGHWRSGRGQKRTKYYERLLTGVPKEPKLLRMRILAWKADGLRRLGRKNEAESAFHQVLNFAPTVLRHLRIPFRFDSKTSHPATTNLLDVRGSPRLSD